jgi:hypothetical protein
LGYAITTLSKAKNNYFTESSAEESKKANQIVMETNAVWPIDNSKNKVSDLESIENSWFTVGKSKKE